MIDDDLSDKCISTPVETVIKENATFCIAGNDISAVFVGCKAPENCTNKKIQEMEIINNAIDDGGENVLSPIDVGLVKEIYKAKKYEYNSKLTREIIEDENYPIHFIDFLQSEEFFYEVIFDDIELDTDYCDRIVLSCIEKIENKEWQPYDITEVLELASRPIKEQYYKVVKESNNLNLPDELFIVQEIDNIIKLLCNRIADIRKLTENEISNYIEYMLKRLLVLNRDIQIEREVLLGFSNVKIGEADMVLYRNNYNLH